MKSALIALASIVLASCASGGGRYDQNSAAYRQCQYEAKIATLNTNNMFTDVYRELELVQMCMTNKGL